MKVKEESEKVGLKLNIQKTKSMAPGPITSWQIAGGNTGNSERLYFWGSKITANVDCSHESKRCLLLGRKARTNLDSILKSRDITLPANAGNIMRHGFNTWVSKVPWRRAWKPTPEFWAGESHGKRSLVGCSP